MPPVVARGLAGLVLAAWVMSPPFASAQALSSPMLVIETCDFWSGSMWGPILHARPGWTPLLGAYNSWDDAVTDRHLDELRSRGISAVQSCWYRSRTNKQGGVDDGFIETETRSRRRHSIIPWALYWDNVNPVGAPASGLRDFLHIAASWIARDLTRSDYLRLDGRAVVMIANARAFADQLGGAARARTGLASFRLMARRAGLAGLVVLTTNNGPQTETEALAREIGFDGVTMYATPAFAGLLPSTAPTDAEVMAAERRSWRLAQTHAELPATITASVGFDTRLWSKGTMHFLLTATDWETLVRSAIEAARRRPARSLGHRLVFLDALNEFGEGHFIEPTVAFGDAYLDAIRRAATMGATKSSAAPRPPDRRSAREAEVR